LYYTIKRNKKKRANGKRKHEKIERRIRYEFLVGKKKRTN